MCTCRPFERALQINSSQPQRCFSLFIAQTIPRLQPVFLFAPLIIRVEYRRHDIVVLNSRNPRLSVVRLCNSENFSFSESFAEADENNDSPCDAMRCWTRVCRKRRAACRRASRRPVERGKRLKETMIYASVFAVASSRVLVHCSIARGKKHSPTMS